MCSTQAAGSREHESKRTKSVMISSSLRGSQACENRLGRESVTFSGWLVKKKSLEVWNTILCHGILLSELRPSQKVWRCDAKWNSIIIRGTRKSNPSRAGKKTESGRDTDGWLSLKISLERKKSEAWGLLVRLRTALRLRKTNSGN